MSSHISFHSSQYLLLHPIVFYPTALPSTSTLHYGRLFHLLFFPLFSTNLTTITISQPFHEELVGLLQLQTDK